MRVIAGKFRGRKIESPTGTDVRPTADRVKEALFQMLGRRCEGAEVLDLYAGSGNLGLEALSRGAAGCCFVENRRRHCEVIRRNCARLAPGATTRIIKKDCLRAIRILESEGARFDLVFADPPYGAKEPGSGGAEKVLSSLNVCDIFAQQATVVLEHSHRDAVGDKYGRLALEKQRRYGDTVLSFFSVRCKKRRS